MKTRVSPTLVGMFVIGALLIALIAVMSFGGVNFFSKPQRFISYFDESTHGLDLGSPVKLRGVRVGRVVDMNIVYNESTSESLVAVVCEFSRNVIVDDKGGLFNVSDRKRLQSMVDHGLHAKLGVQGLATGMLFVELDFEEPDADAPAPPMPSEPEKRYVVVPATTSAIAALQANFSQIMGEVKGMKLPELARDIQALARDARRQINAIDIATINSEVIHASKAVASLAESAEIRRMFTDLGSAINELRNTLAKLDKAVDPLGDNLTNVLADARAALKKAGDAADSAKHFVDSQNGLGENVSRTLRDISEAAASLQRLLDYLERNPSALISGKKQP